MNSKVIGSGLLIAGTCIGAVTIVLPLSLMPLGSIGLLCMLVATACIVYMSGMVIFEIARSFPFGLDLSQMVSKTLGPWSGRLVEVLFYVLLYCLMSAYMTGGSALIAEQGTTHIIGIVIWAFIGQLLLMIGIRAQDFVNRLFVGVLLLCYCVFIVSSLQHINISNMVSVPHVQTISSVAILATAFGFHVIIPSVRDYMGDDSKAHKQSLIIGLAIPFLLYLIWCFALYGLLPFNGAFGLKALSNSKNSFLHITEFLYRLQPSKLIPLSVSGFMLTSILSSYIGIALSLFHALGAYIDKMGIKVNDGWRSLIVLVPPAIFAILKPGGFMLALQYAAVIIAIISFIIPSIMLYKIKSGNLTLKVKAMLLTNIIYACFIVISCLV